jgi:hypothetical protein
MFSVDNIRQLSRFALLANQTGIKLIRKDSLDEKLFLLRSIVMDAYYYYFGNRTTITEADRVFSAVCGYLSTVILFLYKGFISFF